MSFRLVRTTCAFFLCFILLPIFAELLSAQAPADGTAGQAAAPAEGPTGGLTGFVTDPSGAGIPKASVRLTTASGASYDATSNKEGIYEFKGLPPGVYSLKAAAKGFALFTKENVQILAKQQVQVNISLTIQMEEQKVEVTDETTKVDVNPSNNAGTVVMKGKELEALSDDPDELQSELVALAGPSAGPNGGQIYIDGFTAGQLPPKASIREIRINQNPFSSEYDKLGYGRIEILTKPGTDQLHGQLMVMGNTTAFNSRNPFEGSGAPPSYDSEHYEGNLGGSLTKRISFFTNVERRNLNDLSVVNTPFLDPNTLQITQFAGAFPNPRTRTEVSQRFDFQITPSNTLVTRYQYWRNNEVGDGVGVVGLTLPAQGYNALNTEHTLQMTDTQVLGPRTINETRFQYIHQERDQNPLNTTPTISIQGAFSTGGNSGGTLSDTQNRYELQNTTYFNVGKHALKYGGRLRATTDDYWSTAYFNGTYVFGSRPDPRVSGCNVPNPPSTCPQLTGLQAYQIMLQAIASGDTPANVATGIANGGGPSFYSLNSSAAGNATAEVTWFDGALFVQDDWRIRPNVTLSTGLRYEIQNDLGDHADFAPRVGIAWGLDGNGKNKSPKTVLRAGYGVFYDRFASDLVLQQELQNGFVQQQFQVQNPSFFNPNQTTPVSQSGTPEIVYRVNDSLRSPYIMQTGVSVERQLGKNANLSVTYLNSRGVHQFYTNYVPLIPGAPPSPTPQITYEYVSGGIFKQNQLIVNTRTQVGASLTLWGYYTLNYANGDTSGAGYIPSIPCGAPNLSLGTPCGIDEDYGRASFDVRHRVFVGGTASFRWGFRLSPFLIAQSGPPFNVITGQDLYGINTFNARPSEGACGSPGVKSTAFGCFNEVAQPGQVGVPINEETGPARFSLNLRLSKTFGFGAKKETAARGGGMSGGTFGRGPGGPHGDHGGMWGGPSENHYNLTLSVNARNVFNYVNASNPMGNLSSPLFGESNGLVGGPFSSSTANRLIYLQCLFNF
jgi:Carboxypeptidase regulatory-like domain